MWTSLFVQFVNGNENESMDRISSLPSISVELDTRIQLMFEFCIPTRHNDCSLNRIDRDAYGMAEPNDGPADG